MAARNDVAWPRRYLVKNGIRARSPPPAQMIWRRAGHNMRRITLLIEIFNARRADAHAAVGAIFSWRRSEDARGDFGAHRCQW